LSCLDVTASQGRPDIPDYTIRSAGPEDLSGLQDLYRQLAEAEYALDTPHRALLPPLDERVRQLSAHLDALGSDTAVWFVAIADDALIGSVCVHEVQPSPLVVRVMEIGDLVVDKDHRRRGIGGALLVCAYGWGRERGIHGAMLEVAAANTAALRLYAAHGMYSAGRTLVRDLG
jgi:GNAT superfamily N-acetyltransferase